MDRRRREGSAPVIVRLAGRAYRMERQRLGGWLALQEAREELEEAVAARDAGSVAAAVRHAIMAALPGLGPGDLERVPWTEAILAWYHAYRVNAVPGRQRLAILAAGGEKGPSEPWHYRGRLAYLLVHILASAYGWSLTEILRLWPEDAWAYAQEILADQQEQREFLHSLSELAYEPLTSGRVRYRPLPRPRWMRTSVATKRAPTLPGGGLPSRLTPAGMVVRLDKGEKVQ